MAIKELMLNALSGALESVGEIKLEQLLDDLQKKDAAAHRAAVISGWQLVTILEPLVTKTQTPLDNAIVLAMKDAIANSAAKFGIDL